MEHTGHCRRNLMTAAVMLCVVAILFLLNSAAGRQRGTEPPPYFGMAVMAVDDTVHKVVLFDAPQHRSQLIAELRRLGLFREMRLWCEYFELHKVAGKAKK